MRRPLIDNLVLVVLFGLPPAGFLLLYLRRGDWTASSLSGWSLGLFAILLVLWLATYGLVDRVGWALLTAAIVTLGSVFTILLLQDGSLQYDEHGKTPTGLALLVALSGPLISFEAAMRLLNTFSHDAITATCSLRTHTFVAVFLCATLAIFLSVDRLPESRTLLAGFTEHLGSGEPVLPRRIVYFISALVLGLALIYPLFDPSFPNLVLMLFCSSA